MATIGRLMVLIGADTTELGRGLDKAERSVKKFGSDLQSAGMTLTAAISAPLIGIGVASLKMAGEVEQASTAFTTMIKSSDAASQHLKQLQAFALKTPFEFRELVQASRLMQAYGFAAAEVVPRLRGIGNAVSALGGGGELLERMVRSLGEIKTQAKISGEQIRELSRAGIPVRDLLAKALGVSVADAMKKVEAGAIDAKTALDAILGYVQTQFMGGMEAQSKTLLGMWSNVKDALFFTFADVGKTLAPFAKDFMATSLTPMLNKIKELAAAFAKLPKPAQDTALAIAAIGVAGPIATLAMGTMITNGLVLISTMGKLYGVAVGLAGAIGGVLTKAFIGLTSAATVGFPAVTMFMTAITTAGVLAAAYSIGVLASKIWDLVSANEALEKAGKQSDDALAKLAIHLRQNGVSTADLDQKYAHGLISTREYALGLRELAIALGKTKTAQEAAAAAKVPKPISPEELKAAFADLGIKDVAKDARETSAAFNLLRSAGVLSAGQLQAGFVKVKEALGAVKQAALTVQDVFRGQKLTLAAPDARDFERTWDAMRGLVTEAGNLSAATGQVGALGSGWTRAMFEADDATERARRGLSLLGVDFARLNKDLHFEEAVGGFRDLNIKSTAELWKLRDEAQQAFDAIRTASTSTDADILQAQARLNSARLALLRNLAYDQRGEARKTTDAEIEELERWEWKNREILVKISGDHERKSRAVAGFWRGMGNQVSTILTDLSRQMLDTLWPRGGGSTKDTAAIAKLGIAAGVTGAQLDALVRTVENLALATGESFGTMADSAAEVFRTFGVAAADQVATLEMLFRASKLTNTGIADLMSGLSRGAATFRALGIPLADAAVLLGRLSQSGADTSRIIGALESAMKKLSEQGFVRPGEELREIIGRIKTAGTVSEATALAVRYFGEAGQDMAAMIRAGNLNLNAMASQLADVNDNLAETAAKTREATAEQGKFAAIMSDVGRAILRAIAEEGIRALVDFVKESKTLKGLWTDIKDVITGAGKAAAKIGTGEAPQGMGLPGGIWQGAGEGTGEGAASAAGGAASAGGSAASAAGSSVSAWVGAISSAVTAISSVIGNFQMAGMNKSLDLIEHETRYSQIHLLNILEKANLTWPKLTDLMSYMWEVQEPYLRQINDGIQSWASTAMVNAFPVFQPQMVSAAAGDVITESRGGDTFYIDGINAGGADADALEMFKEGARLLRARGVRGTPGIR